MALYSLDKLIEETRKLAAEFRRTTGTMLPVSGEIARYDVSTLLDLQLTDQRTGGVDAIGQGSRTGQRIQIKGRVIADSVKSVHRLGQFNMDGDWNTVILSLMDDNFEPQEIYEASRGDIMDALQPDSKRAKRGALSVAKFKIISKLIWTKETGLET